MQISLTSQNNFYIANSNKALSQRQGLSFLGNNNNLITGILNQNSARTARTVDAKQAFVNSGKTLLKALKASQDGHTAQLLKGNDGYSINQNGIHTLQIFNSVGQLVQEITLDANQPDGVLAPLRQLLTSLQPKT